MLADIHLFIIYTYLYHYQSRALLLMTTSLWQQICYDFYNM